MHFDTTHGNVALKPQWSDPYTDRVSPVLIRTLNKLLKHDIPQCEFFITAYFHLIELARLLSGVLTLNENCKFELLLLWDKVATQTLGRWEWSVPVFVCVSVFLTRSSHCFCFFTNLSSIILLNCLHEMKERDLSEEKAFTSQLI